MTETALALLRALRAAGLTVGPRDLLDAVLVASAFPTTPRARPAPTAPASRPEPDPAPPVPIPVPPKPVKPVAPAPVAESRYPVESVGRGGKGERPGVPVRLPPGGRSFRAAAVLRALHPFRRRVPSLTEWEPDEEATAEVWGRARAPVVQIRPRMVKEWTAHLVLDASASMDVWSGVTAAFARLVAGSGVFRTVRTLAVDADSDRLTVAGRRPRPVPLRPPCGPRGVVLVISDCCSRAWWTGEALRQFADWGRGAAVGLVCVLPEAFWPRTAIGRHRFVRLNRPADGGPLYALAPPEGEGAVLPAASLDARSFATLPPLLGHNARPAVGGGVWVGPYFRPPDLLEEALAPAEIVRRFLAIASLEAIRLAGLLALFDRVTITTLRLIRAAAGLQATAAQDAEVLLSGLLRGERTTHGTRPGWTYKFRDEVRDELRAAGLLGGAKAEAFFDRFQSYLARRRDEAQGVPAALPLSTGERRVRAMEDQFLDLDADMLTALGPKAAGLAGELRAVQQLAKDGPGASAPKPGPRDLTSAREKEQEELAEARRVLRGVLPSALPDVPGYEFYVHYSPAQAIGGDYYDFIPLPDGRIAIVLGDAPERGTAAALLLVSLSSAARSCVAREPNLARAATLLNEVMYRGALGVQFVPLAVLVLDPAAHEVTLVNAGHFPPKWSKARTGEFVDAHAIDAVGVPIGMLAGYTYAQVTFALAPGDSIALFTDGATDAQNPAGAVLSAEEVDRILETGPRRPAQMGERLVAAVRAHADGRPQQDDLTVLVFGRQARQKPSNLPQFDGTFVGRNDELNRLEQSREGIPGTVTTFRAAHAITGAAGIGKTRFAVEFARRREAEYTAVFFVRADSTAALEAGLAELCALPGVNLPEAADPRPKVRLTAFHRWLAENAGWLLILDGANTDEAAGAANALLLRADTGHVLITGSHRAWNSWVNAVELPLLAPAETTQLLLDRTATTRQQTPTDEAEATALAGELGGLPLTVELAASLIATHSATLHEYAHILWQSARDPEDGPLTRVFRSALELLTNDGRALLDVLAWFAAAPIPVEVFGLRPRHGGWAPMDASAGLDDLRRHGLVVSAPADEVQLHPWVARLSRDSRARETAEWSLGAALAWLAAAIRARPTRWLPWLAPHIESATGFADDDTIIRAAPRLVSDLGRFYLDGGHYAQAVSTNQHALALMEHGGETQTADYVLQLHATGRAYLLMGNTRAALRMLDSALTLGTRIPDVRPTELAAVICDLATARSALGEVEAATALFRRALQLQESAFGRDHPNLIPALSGLGNALLQPAAAGAGAPELRRLNDIARSSEAVAAFRRVTTIAEAQAQTEAPEYTEALRGLASVSRFGGDFATAERFLRQALDLDTRSHGSYSPEVVSNLIPLADVLAATGRNDDAATALRQATDVLDALPQGPLKDRLAVKLGAMASVVSGQAPPPGS